MGRKFEHQKGTEMKATIITIGIVVGILMILGNRSIESGPPPSAGEPIMLTESEARDVLREEVLSYCGGSIGITLGKSKAMRITELAKADKASDHWIFRADGLASKVYQSGVVTGDLFDELLSICGRGNK